MGGGGTVRADDSFHCERDWQRDRGVRGVVGGEALAGVTKKD